MSLGAFRSAKGRATYVAAYERALAEMPAPSRTIDVPTGFGDVRAYEWVSGEAPGTPVLLLPGRGSGVPMWKENLPELLPHRRVIAVDALGDAGLSTQTAPMSSMTDQATWIDEVLGGMGEECAHVVGHSFGGATAAALAVERPRRVASLALLEPAFTLALPPVSTFLLTVIASLPLPQALRDHALARIGGIDVAEVRTRSAISEMIASGSAEFRAALPTPKPLTDAQVNRLSMPVYIAIASRSSLVGGERALRRARGIPGAHVEVWPDTTHSLPMQVHAALAERLAAFWSGVDA
ncbi:carboxylesterase [Pseudoclavibacter endophyticus]|uniref:Alpha/beta fold hydrolase n=1 Tax=Pseudoclavibacter endophyticus TaxID=1778590 RepID=A0A6H9WQH0_9MICO|nr:alpha/beta hydrolase [Pseudoclavibacter endophyticus]KAB1649951.1 alpha/beta fold hydrolase [Pseudoclavibacter endophyticus]GGA58455.1 carboxylesterase [Pseudoclavibacter endophyticus]